MADLQRTVYPHSGHPLAEGRAQDRVSSPAKDRRSANCATQPTCWLLFVVLLLLLFELLQVQLLLHYYYYYYNNKTTTTTTTTSRVIIRRRIVVVVVVVWAVVVVVVSYNKLGSLYRWSFVQNTTLQCALIVYNFHTWNALFSYYFCAILRFR